MPGTTRLTDARPPAVVTESGERNVMVNATFVRLMITVTIAIVVAMTALIFYRSQTVVEPTAAIVIVGDKYEQGTQIDVREYDSVTRTDGREVAKTTLTGENQNVTPILVEPGDYHLIATAPDGHLLIDQVLTTVHMRTTTLSLPTSVVVIGNSSFADAQIAVSDADDGGNRLVMTLTAENNYRAAAYRHPGRGQITVTHNGKVLVDREFTVKPLESAADRRQSPIIIPLAPREVAEEADVTSSPP